jgi:hypothetical protein
VSADDECEEWVGWLDLPPKRVIRATGRVRRVITCNKARALLDEGKRGTLERLDAAVVVSVESVWIGGDERL